MIDWEKSGCIFKAEGQYDFMRSHTAMPIPLHLYDDIFRVYFSTRGERNNPQVGYIEIDINKPSKILAISEKPVLENGPEGFFDYNGLYSGCIVKRDDELWMYYSGRANLENGMYQVEVGLAISKDGGLTFKKYSDSPIFGRNINDPWLVSTPHVVPCEDGWRMYYLSGRGIERYSESVYKPYYDVRTAISENGISWTSENNIVLPLINDISNIAAPTIITLNGEKRMFFSFIEKELRVYNIGSALWQGEKWEYKNEIFDAIEKENWDTHKAYPHAIVHKDKVYLFYCGNEFGKGGLGFISSKLK